MPPRNISLTAVQDAFIDRMVRNGTYQNASEAVRDAPRLLHRRRQENAARLKEPRRQVQPGLDDFARGDFVEVDLDNVEGFFSALAVETKQATD